MINMFIIYSKKTINAELNRKWLNLIMIFSKYIIIVRFI
jgi:hypothetical protein